MIKTIFVTFTATVAVVFLVASLFLNTILGAFGMAATSIETLQNLKTSQQIVERMKTRQAQKKLKVTKRFAKRPAKRIASAAVAAATVGTIGVAVAVTALEANDYCEEKRELQEDTDILNGTHTEFDYEACYEEGKKDLSSVLSQVKDSTVDAVANAWKSTAHYSTEKWVSIKESCSDALESTGTASSRLWDAAVAWVAE
jgi:hypothetical protein